MPLVISDLGQMQPSWSINVDHSSVPSGYFTFLIPRLPARQVIGYCVDNYDDNMLMNTSWYIKENDL